MSDDWRMTTRLFREDTRPHGCDLPRLDSVTEGDIAQCIECGKWWRRGWHNHQVRPIWEPISRWRAWRLRRSGRFTEVCP